MSDSLRIENLSKLVDVDAKEPLVGSKVVREMAMSGLEMPSPQDGSKSFSEIMRDSVDKVNLYQSQADTAIKELVSGRSKNIHETMLAIERADSSLKLMMQVRNKVLDAYREIMRMQA